MLQEILSDILFFTLKIGDYRENVWKMLKRMEPLKISKIAKFVSCVLLNRESWLRKSKTFKETCLLGRSRWVAKAVECARNVLYRTFLAFQVSNKTLL